MYKFLYRSDQSSSRDPVATTKYFHLNRTPPRASTPAELEVALSMTKDRLAKAIFWVVACSNPHLKPFGDFGVLLNSLAPSSRGSIRLCLDPIQLSISSRFVSIDCSLLLQSRFDKLRYLPPDTCLLSGHPSAPTSEACPASRSLPASAQSYLPLTVDENSLRPLRRGERSALSF